MNVADTICKKAKDLPEPLAREVLEFIEQISEHLDSATEPFKKAQEPVMKQIWDNKEDDIWNEL
jgi:hypothetical protein